MTNLNYIEIMKEKVLSGEMLTKAEALRLYQEDAAALGKAADEIRQKLCGSTFDLCTIVNAKSGKCPEDCKYCAQSAHYPTAVKTYPLLAAETMAAEARHNSSQGVLRYSIVTSGRRLTAAEVDDVCAAVRLIRAESPIQVCVSLGLLSESDFRRLKAAGVSRVHCNLETSRNYFPQVCTTHTYDEKIAVIRAAQAAGLAVCSGGIMGMGETPEDRIDLALTLRELGINSIPINFLNPIKGTPYEHNPLLKDEEKSKIIALFRFMLPGAAIRLAGGRGLIADKGEMCFRSGANAAISGDMLTTAGITVATDLQMLEKLNYKVELKK